jgi:putative endonuclease
MYFVYVITSTRRKYTYTGISANVEKRLFQHNSGYNKATKPYLPFELVLTEKHPDRKSARAREKYLKSGVGREYIKSLRK